MCYNEPEPKRCDDCQAELTYCGDMTADGPSLDCPQCQLRYHIITLRNMLRKAMYFVEMDALMMADITRHAPLPPEEQAKHDNTKAASEVLMDEYLAAFPEERANCKTTLYHKAAEGSGA